jgi:hypothetical protein
MSGKKEHEFGKSSYSVTLNYQASPLHNFAQERARDKNENAPQHPLAANIITESQKKDLLSKNHLLPLNYNYHDPRSVNQRLMYASFVSTKQRLLYVETPKAACTALKWILAHIDGYKVPLVVKEFETQLEMCIHYRDVHPLPSLNDFNEQQANEILKHPSYRRFSVVRNPFTRLVSAWANKIRQAEPGHRNICLAIFKHAGRDESVAAPTFREFANWVLETNDPTKCYTHWRSQKHLLYPDLIDYGFVLKVENLSSDLQQLFNSASSTKEFDAKALLSKYNYNESLPLNYDDLYDRRLAERVSDFYADDFATYGYDKNSWTSLSTKGNSSVAELEAAALKAIRQRNKVIEQMAQVIKMMRTNSI